MDSRRVRVVAAGDINLGRDVSRVIRERGADHPLSGVRDVMLDADLRIANLECVLTPPGREVPPSMFQMCAPWAFAEGVADLPIEVLFLANNHILDHGAQAARDTEEFCRSRSLLSVGFGASPALAKTPRVVEINGLRIGLLAYVEDFPLLRRKHSPGPAYLPADPRDAVMEVRRARETVDTLVVSLHGDLEFETMPSPWRVALSRDLADAGADLVLAHHPHVPQGLERRGRSLIAYSLGNFIFDVQTRRYMSEGSPYTGRSVLLQVELGAEGVVDWSLVPYEIDETHRPVVMSAERGQGLLDDIARWSDDLADPGKVMAAWQSACTRQLDLGIRWIIEAQQRGGRDEVLRVLEMFLYDGQRHVGRQIYDWLQAGLPVGGVS